MNAASKAVDVVADAWFDADIFLGHLQLDGWFGGIELLALCRQQWCGLGQHLQPGRDAENPHGHRPAGLRHAVCCG